MRSRGWLKDFFSHLVLILLFAVGLFFVWRKVNATPGLAALVWLRWLLYASAAILAVLLIVFVNGLLSSYYLERFDPVKPASLKRLERIRRFRLNATEKAKLLSWAEPLPQIAHMLGGLGYTESARWRHGIVYTKKRLKKARGFKPMVDQFFVCYKPILNVLIVDGVLRDCMLTITKTKGRRNASRNFLLFVTDSQDQSEVTSSAAGVVNFLGKIEEGSLGPMLLDTQFGRLFYPLDRSLIRLHHRRIQDMFRRYLRQRIRSDRPLRRGERFGSAEHAGETGGVRRVTLNLNAGSEPEGTDAGPS